MNEPQDLLYDYDECHSSHSSPEEQQHTVKPEFFFYNVD